MANDITIKEKMNESKMPGAAAALCDYEAANMSKGSLSRMMGHRTQVLVAALFIIAQAWKQRGHPSADEWIGKPWYIQKWNIIPC